MKVPETRSRIHEVRPAMKFLKESAAVIIA